MVLVNGDIEFNDIVGINWMMSYDWFSVCVVYFVVNIIIVIENDIDVGVVFNGFE